MNNFLENFLKISTLPTLIAIILLVVGVVIMSVLKNKKVSFSSRMLIALFLGIGIGIGVDLIFGSSEIYKEVSRQEISSWFNIVGGTFVKLIQLVAIPVVFLSLFFVILDFEGKNIKGFTIKSLALLLGTTAISAVIGILVVHLFNLTNTGLQKELGEAMTERIAGISESAFPDYFSQLIPNNIYSTFSSNSAIISVAIISVLFATSARFLRKKGSEEIEDVIKFFAGMKKLITSVLINVIKIMPYAIIALVGRTIISNGIESITALIGFIGALYTGVIAMLLVYVVILTLVGVNPITFYKKAFSTLVFAFSSRSSVGTLPHTLDTLENKLGVSSTTTNFIGSLSTTVGMNGCAGVFPAMLGTIVAASAGVELNISFYVLLVIVVTLGSIGIAGVPGTSTVAATVTLNGIGLGSYFDRVGSIFGIDPIIDMGRTMLNVAGAMVSAVVVDRWEGNMDMDKFAAKIEEE